MRIVALAGPKYSGKDTAGKGLLKLNAENDRLRVGDNYYFFRLAKMAEGVKNVCKEVFGYTDELMEDPALKEQKTDFFPFIEPRWPMMDIANWMRDKYGADIWARRWERKAKQADNKGVCHVVTDFRFPEEAEMFKRHDALMVYVYRAEAEVALRKKQAAGDAMALNASESHYDFLKEVCTHHLINDGSPVRMQAELQSLVKLRYGHWNYWSREERK